MKTITLLVASILLTANVTKANETKSFYVLNFENQQFDVNEPISFNERGISFFVFSNGEFDFNTRPNDSQGTYQYKQAGKRMAVADDRNDENFGVLIERDNFGRIRRVGNTFINYDNRDRVSRIGSVFMRYNRFALTQVGGLQIVYNRRGEIVDMFGEVKGCRNSGFTNNYYGSSYGYAYNNNNNDDSTVSNNDYYYYKTDGTRGKIEDNKKEERR